MKTRWTILALTACLSFGVAACDAQKKDDKAAEDKDDEKKDDKDEGDEDGDEKAGGKGLDHPDNDADIVKLAKGALGCEWQDNYGLKSSCEELKTWNKEKKLRDKEATPTLLNMLEDDKKEVRWLAANTLSSASGYTSDKDAAKRVFAVAEKEKDPVVGERVGRLVGQIRVDKTGMDGDIKKMLAEHDNQKVRKGIVGSVLFNNRKEGGFYDLLTKMAREEKDKEVRKAAAAAFWTGGSERKDDTCNLWLELAADSDKDIAGHSAYHCSWWSTGGGCQDQWGKLLDTIEARAKKGDVQETFMTSALGWLQKQKEADDATKKRALEVAKAVIENDKNAKSARSDSLRIIGEHDPGAKTYAAKFKDDKDFGLKHTAERIIEGKIGPKK